MKVLLIDDHPLILSALQSVIQGLGDDVTVVGAGSARAARETLQADSDFDLVLLDLQLGDADGFDVLVEFRAQYPALPVVVVSASDRSSDVIRAIDLGAMGFVPKRASNDTLFEALHMVMSGGIYVPPMTMGAEPAPRQPEGDTVPSVLRVVREQAEAQRACRRSRRSTSLGLTPRQTDVLALLLQGKPNKLIARDLNLSVETVKDHVAAVLRALDVSSRTQAVLAVSQMTHKGGLDAWRNPGAVSAATAAAGRRDAGGRRAARHSALGEEVLAVYAYTPATLAGLAAGVGMLVTLFWASDADGADAARGWRCSSALWLVRIVLARRFQARRAAPRRRGRLAALARCAGTCCTLCSAGAWGLSGWLFYGAAWASSRPG